MRVLLKDLRARDQYRPAESLCVPPFSPTASHVLTHLVEADGGHGPLVELLLEVRGQDQLLGAEAVVPEQEADLHGDLDQVLDDLLGLGLVARVLFGDVVQLVQDLAGRVVDEHLDRGFVGHLAEDLLLGRQGQRPGFEVVHGCLSGEKRKVRGVCVCVCVSLATNSSWFQLCNRFYPSSPRGNLMSPRTLGDRALSVAMETAEASADLRRLLASGLPPLFWCVAAAPWRRLHRGFLHPNRGASWEAGATLEGLEEDMTGATAAFKASVLSPSLGSGFTGTSLYFDGSVLVPVWAQSALGVPLASPGCRPVPAGMRLHT